MIMDELKKVCYYCECLPVHGPVHYAIVLTIAACLAVQDRKGQPNGSLENHSRRVQGLN